MTKLTPVIIVFLLTQACSSLNTRRDYQYTTKNLQEGDVSAAITAFPTKERKSFITLLEKTYLSIINGKPDIEDLAEYAHRIDSQVRIKVSREFKTFFYLETPEGYYASEHEIILMHLFLSWGHSMLGNYDKARVEVKKSTILLSEKWSDEGRFDDPLLRIFSAIAWSMCGEWEEAQVDFRRAAILKPSLKWATYLGNRTTPPQKIILILGGTGPEPFWKPYKTGTLEDQIADIKNKKGYISANAKNTGFLYPGQRSSLLLTDNNGKNVTMHITPASKYWYKRHLTRHTALHDVIQDTKYMQITAVAASEGCLTIVGGTVIGMAVIVSGIAIGGGIIYLGLAAESGELAAAGIGIGAGIAGFGVDVISSSSKKAKRTYKRRTDMSDTYRFVRFLPEYAWIGWSSQKLSYPLKVYIKKDRVKPIIKIEKPVNTVHKFAVISIGFYHDTN